MSAFAPHKKQHITVKILPRVAAVLAFVFCFAGGAWFLCHATGNDNVLPVGLGLYFVGKAFFVGPMLWLAAGKCSQTSGQ
jgi:hypothetical protein